MPERVIIKASRIANENTSGWLNDHAIVIEDDIIESVTPIASLGSTDNAKVLDLGDVSVLPGLVDAHCHMHCSATHDAQALALTEMTNN